MAMIASKGAVDAADAVEEEVVVVACWVKSEVDEERRSVAAMSPVVELAAAWTWDALYILYKRQSVCCVHERAVQSEPTFEPQLAIHSFQERSG